jgi:UDP-N-acetylmuramate dehydrogenase
MIFDTARSELAGALGERIRFGVPMSKHTSLRIGGPADAFATPADRAELAALLKICHRHALPFTVLGSGFNVLVRDTGIDGVVLTLKKLRRLETGTPPSVYAEAGVSHASVTRFCVDHGLSGLEFAAGIPGTVGGWIAMNAGIGVREQKDVVQEIEILLADGSEERCVPREQLDFRYRELRGLPEGALVIAARFAVTPSSPEAVRGEVDRLLGQRSGSQPLDVPSCGSVFRNPEGDHAGRLIEAAGLRGERIGNAQISPVHANFIANLGGATAADVLALIDRARDRVRESSGVVLCTEVKVMGRAS